MPLEIRRGLDSDLPAILNLLRDSLGWAPDERHEALFSWKHRASPFGPSAAWLGFDGEHLVGLRMLMRWEFEHDGRVQRAVRAVDTATHPDYRGRGVFTALTLRALEDLEREDVAFVFNTPNDQSRPGYLKMGWRVVGRLPVAVRPSSPAALARMMRARTPAERWSAPSAAGMPALDALGDRTELERLLASRRGAGAMTTRLTPEYLMWRYGSRPIDYRALVGREGVRSGLAIFRVRQRGPTREMVLCDVLVAGDDERLRRDLLRRVAQVADTDYVIAIEQRAVSAAGFVRLPRQGPILTSRLIGADRVPTLGEWQLRLGDVELF